MLNNALNVEVEVEVEVDATNDRLKASLKKSFTDIINPVDGWKSIVQDQVPKAASHQQGMKSIAIQ